MRRTVIGLILAGLALSIIAIPATGHAAPGFCTTTIQQTTASSNKSMGMQRTCGLTYVGPLVRVTGVADAQFTACYRNVCSPAPANVSISVQLRWGRTNLVYCSSNRPTGYKPSATCTDTTIVPFNKPQPKPGTMLTCVVTSNSINAIRIINLGFCESFAYPEPA
jgi:hypothetical protein